MFIKVGMGENCSPVVVNTDKILFFRKDNYNTKQTEMFFEGHFLTIDMTMEEVEAMVQNKGKDGLGLVIIDLTKKSEL